MELFFSEGLRIFSVIAGITLVLAIFEIIMLMLGISFLSDSDAAEGGADFEAAGLDVDGDIPELDTLSADEIALLDIDRDDRVEFLRPEKTGVKKFMSSIGLGNGPLMAALACMSGCVSSIGFLLQFGLEAIMGFMLHPLLALALVLYPGLRMAGSMTKWLARLVPGFETQAISGGSFNGRRGMVTTGSASRDNPAQVRWYDSYGTMHHTMAEPLQAEDVIPAGTPVLLLRTRDRQARIITTS